MFQTLDLDYSKNIPNLFLAFQRKNLAAQYDFGLPNFSYKNPLFYAGACFSVLN